jgi:hypothetical protein
MPLIVFEFEITYKLEVKLTSARHMKAWGGGINFYSYTHCDIQHWIQVSAECEAPGAVPQIGRASCRERVFQPV